jgi:hypothetical protein
MPFTQRVYGPLNRYDPIRVGPAVLTPEEQRTRLAAAAALKTLRDQPLSDEEQTDLEWALGREGGP